MKPIRIQLLPRWRPKPWHWQCLLVFVSANLGLAAWVWHQHSLHQARLAHQHAQALEAAATAKRPAAVVLPSYQSSWEQAALDSQVDWLAALRALDGVAVPGVTPRALSYVLKERRLLLDVATGDPQRILDYVAQLNAGLEPEDQASPGGWRWQIEQWQWHAASASYNVQVGALWAAPGHRPASRAP